MSESERYLHNIDFITPAAVARSKSNNSTLELLGIRAQLYRSKTLSVFADTVPVVRMRGWLLDAAAQARWVQTVSSRSIGVYLQRLAGFSFGVFFFFGECILFCPTSASASGSNDWQPHASRGGRAGGDGRSDPILPPEHTCRQADTGEFWQASPKYLDMEYQKAMYTTKMQIFA